MSSKDSKNAVADNADYLNGVIPQISFLAPGGEVRRFKSSDRPKACHACKNFFLPDELHCIQIKHTKYRLCLGCLVSYKTKVYLLGG